jgi:hypothetical protein
MGKENKWKVVISENVVRKMEALPKQDQKGLMKAMEKLAEDPFAGKPLNAVEIKSWDNEKCKCGQPFLMLLELDDSEVHFTCRTGACDEAFWCTKKELIDGRKKYVKDANAAGEKLEYRGIDFAE